MEEVINQSRKRIRSRAKKSARGELQGLVNHLFKDVTQDRSVSISAYGQEPLAASPVRVGWLSQFQASWPHSTLAEGGCLILVFFFEA